ncbi:DUF2188 domain-containing protein [Methylobacterium sp. J-030]|uniref:DUF2188 domain-containing protein n=1 Tax=Methylobacterium sp. J-030 TaxID=2836627 RepID=UPI001FBB4942|nr:DUF2188 domain-containing protein [Methylobacterium sp. J-030]MCJ2072663.1 DUF2188 domain-containing protein [Methylobacterium sp. J-030]
MGRILTFGPRPAPSARPKLPRAPWGADIFLVRYGHPPHAGCWTVFDESPSGGSAGSHGDYTDRAEAVRAGRQLAEEIGGTFHDGGA